MLSVNEVGTSAATAYAFETDTFSIRPGFSSPKALFPVRYGHRWHRDGLIQLSLEAATVSIRFDEEASGRAIEGDFPLRVGTDGGDLSVIFAERPEDERLQHLDGLPQIVIGRKHVYREPVCTVARMLWATRRARVSVGDRLRILGVVTLRSVFLGELGDVVLDKTIDPFSAVGRLICEGELTVPIDRPITPETVVSRANRISAEAERRVSVSR